MIWNSNPAGAALGFQPFDWTDPVDPINPPPLPERHAPGPYLCQLAHEYDASRFPARGAIVDEKIDGIRAVSLGGQPPESRECLPLDFAWWMGGVLPILCERLGPGEWMIDGELVSGPSLDSTLAALKRGKMDPAARLYVFDAIPLHEWESGKPGDPLHERKRRLREAFAKGPIDGLHLCPSWECALAAYVPIIAERMWQQGGEGVVIKDRHAPYERSRTRAWMKLKREQTFTVTITGWAPQKHKPGKEPPDGLPRLGALKGKCNGRAVRISAGDGWTDDTRRLMAGHADTLTGRTAEVRAMERNASGSLRHPVFIRWRHEGEG